jgi:hypothetical protein
MGQHKFKTFLNKRRWTADLERQFVDDAELDPTLPDAASWEQLETYLNEHEAVPHALALRPNTSGSSTRKSAPRLRSPRVADRASAHDPQSGTDHPGGDRGCGVRSRRDHPA